jgi:hypothetical protein
LRHFQQQIAAWWQIANIRKPKLREKLRRRTP